jgi:ubiquinone/menaquinone biosynthesis C-methylase UbiE
MASQPGKKTVTGYYDGAPYARFVDRVSADMLRLVADAVPVGVSLVDICCGTGALAFLCADKCSEVLGVDISPKMIDYAETKRRERGLDNVRFLEADASAMPDVGDNEFDYATVVMGLHEMPTSVRPRVLAEVARVAETLLVVDFLPRMRWNAAGVRNRIVEALAGPRHFGGFRDFSKRGGLPPLIEQAGLAVERRGLIDGRNIEIYTLSTE